MAFLNLKTLLLLGVVSVNVSTKISCFLLRKERCCPYWFIMKEKTENGTQKNEEMKWRRKKIGRNMLSCD